MRLILQNNEGTEYVNNDNINFMNIDQMFDSCVPIRLDFRTETAVIQVPRNKLFQFKVMVTPKPTEVLFTIDSGLN